MINLGIVRPGRTLIIPWDTFAASTGASITSTGLAVTDIEVYKDSSMTQRSSDAGYTLLDTDGIDLDGTTGIQGISINLADNTDAGFYACGARYRVVIASVTIDGQTVNFHPVVFEIGYSAAVFNTTIATLSSQTSFTLTAGPAEDDALNDTWAIIHDVASAEQWGKAIILDYTGSTKTVTLVAGTTFTVAATDNISIMGPMPMQSTVIGARLDVTATGAAGMDWGNVENKTTTNALTNTTVADSAGVTTLLARLGAFAGTGVNTVLGFFQALFRDDVSTPSDIGGTFTPTTMSLEAFQANALTTTDISTDILKKDWTGITGEPLHSVLNAMRFILNEWDMTSNPGFVTVMKEDEATAAFKKAVVSDAAAEPIISVDGPVAP